MKVNPGMASVRPMPQSWRIRWALWWRHQRSWRLLNLVSWGCVLLVGLVIYLPLQRGSERMEQELERLSAQTDASRASEGEQTSVGQLSEVARQRAIFQSLYRATADPFDVSDWSQEVLGKAKEAGLLVLRSETRQIPDGPEEWRHVQIVLSTRGSYAQQRDFIRAALIAWPQAAVSQLQLRAANTESSGSQLEATIHLDAWQSPASFGDKVEGAQR